MKPICGAVAALFALGLLSAAGVAATAQTGAAPAGAAPAAPAALGGPPSAAGGPPPEEPSSEGPGREAPVLLITSVEVMRSTHPPRFGVLRVHGLAATSGWTHPTLKPLTQGESPDGSLDLVLEADAPPPGPQPLGFSPIAEVLPIEPGHAYKGFRVHGGINGVTITRLPGYAEVQPAIDDCANCVGKVFVPT